MGAGSLSEFFARPDEREIRLEKGKRQVRNFEIFKPNMDGALLLHQNGVYLITGGLGGVGRVFARYLARQFRARLILTGRSQLTDETRATIAEIEKLGGQVLYVPGNIARAEE